MRRPGGAGRGGASGFARRFGADRDRGAGGGRGGPGGCGARCGGGGVGGGGRGGALRRGRPAEGKDQDHPGDRSKLTIKVRRKGPDPAMVRPVARPGRAGGGMPVGGTFGVQEARAVMVRVARVLVTASTLSVLCGCAGPKWYRAIGSIPGVAWSAYAFTFYCDTATQLYPAAPGQIESSVLEALADLGFRDVAPPER